MAVVLGREVQADMQPRYSKTGRTEHTGFSPTLASIAFPRLPQADICASVAVIMNRER